MAFLPQKLEQWQENLSGRLVIREKLTGHRLADQIWLNGTHAVYHLDQLATENEEVEIHNESGQKRTPPLEPHQCQCCSP